MVLIDIVTGRLVHMKKKRIILISILLCIALGVGIFCASPLYNYYTKKPVIRIAVVAENLGLTIEALHLDKLTWKSLPKTLRLLGMLIGEEYRSRISDVLFSERFTRVYELKENGDLYMSSGLFGINRYFSDRYYISWPKYIYRIHLDEAQIETIQSYADRIHAGDYKNHGTYGGSHILVYDPKYPGTAVEVQYWDLPEAEQYIENDSVFGLLYYMRGLFEQQHNPKDSIYW